ncbi:DUF4178 domain-containing protein [Tenacibaculum singaporense]|uniref:DUF4178 domain-containing protein n=1 Tax=Tenacibaculum singaporense TaxID=2358479 RepID=UPI000F678ADC|nr:DUF4178 domain-containing protein [Tenacibaculum singaporense]RSC95143.1 DUF4178 domain-containing protein [Tenacibaculum singaporense]
MFWKTSKNYHLDKLKVGYTFTLYGTSWKITEVAQYDWRMDNFSVEYTIISSSKEAFLEVELYKGNYEVTYSEVISIEEAYLIDALQTKELFFNNKLYVLDEVYTGDYKNLTTYSSRENLECFLFYAKDEEMLTVEKWEDGSYEVFLGEEIKAKKIKNIKEN